METLAERCEECPRPATWGADTGAGGMRYACDPHHAAAVRLDRSAPKDVEPIPESWWKRLTACAWCDRLIGEDGNPTGPKGAAAQVKSHGICLPCKRDVERKPTRPNFLPDGVSDALDSVDWDHVTKFPGGVRGYARYAADTVARRVELRRNPALILVHGNPRPPSEVERAWCKFHERDAFTGAVRDVGKIPGAPDYTFALGRCVDVDLGRGPQRFSPMPWLVFSPKDESLWIVAEKPIRLGNGVAGAEVRAVTYDPMASSGKDPAKYRHRFESPRPSFSPVGNPNYCRAVLLDGGAYRVDDWIRD